MECSHQPPRLEGGVWFYGCVQIGIFLFFFVLSFHHPRPAMILTQRITQTCSLMVLNPLMLKQLNHSIDYQSHHMKLRWSDLVIITRASDGEAAESHRRAFLKLVTSVPFHWSRQFQGLTEIIGKITNSLSSCHQNHASNSFCRINEKQPINSDNIDLPFSQIYIDL